MAHICPAAHVRLLDNFLRPMIHNPEKMYAAYVKPGMNVMDMGCGGGFASIGLAGLVGHTGSVTAVDLQENMLAFVEKRAREKGLLSRIRLHQCGKTEIGLTGQFDFINAFYMVHEVPDTEKLFKQFVDLMKPDARLFIAEPILHVSGRAFRRMTETALRSGLKICDRPKVRFSKAVVFSK